MVADRLAYWLGPEARLLYVGRRRGERFGARAWGRDVSRLAARLTRGDLVHVHTSLRPRALARDGSLLEVARARGCPAVLHVHGWDRAWVKDAPWWARRLMRDADVVLAVDPACATELETWGLEARVIANPFEPRFVQRRRPVPGRVLYVGRLAGGKGLDELLDAWCDVETAVPGASLVLAGDGPSAPQIRRRVERRRLTQTVSLVGWQHPAAISAALSEACLLVLPSWEEAAPVSVIEALAAGVPVVATRTGRIPELVGLAGELVSVGDSRGLAASLVRVLEDPERGRAGPEQVAQCHPQRVVQHLRRIYAAVA